VNRKIGNSPAGSTRIQSLRCRLIRQRRSMEPSPLTAGLLYELTEGRAGRLVPERLSASYTTTDQKFPAPISAGTWRR
jgi:hypothetical protein